MLSFSESNKNDDDCSEQSHDQQHHINVSWSKSERGTVFQKDITSVRYHIYETMSVIGLLHFSFYGFIMTIHGMSAFYH